MRLVIQRVKEASVAIAGTVKGSIGPGLLVLVAVEAVDTQEDIEWLCGKIVKLRVFDDENGVMNRSVQDIGGDVLVVSQFTLYADCSGGNRPSYTAAAPPDKAEPLLDDFVRLLRELGCTVATGRFRALMQVELENDGPVTIVLESRAGQRR